jgi:hypothetical protein
MVDAPNVTPLREAQAAAPFAAATAAAGGASADSASAEELDFDIAQTYQQVANGSPTATDLAATGLGGFASPFDDEFETPAFLRKGVGSFMRRGGD